MSESPSRFVSITDFGDTSRRTPDITILGSHAEGRKFTGPFWDAFPDVRSHLHPTDRSVFEDYLDLEYDVGTSPLALETALALARTGNFVRVIRILVHRAVLDCNRMDFLNTDGSRTLALRNIWNPDQDHTALFARLQAVHQEVMDTVLAAVSDTRLFLDLHSMAPYSPVSRHHASDAAIKSAQEEPGFLRDYRDDFVFAKTRGGLRRPVDFVSTTASGELLIDPDFRETIRALLHRADLPAKANDPYTLGDKRLLGKELLTRLEHRGLVIDIPKPFLTEDPQNSERIVHWRDLSLARIHFFATIFNSAANQRLAA